MTWMIILPGHAWAVVAVHRCSPLSESDRVSEGPTSGNAGCRANSTVWGGL